MDRHRNSWLADVDPYLLAPGGRCLSIHPHTLLHPPSPVCFTPAAPTTHRDDGRRRATHLKLLPPQSSARRPAAPSRTYPACAVPSRYAACSVALSAPQHRVTRSATYTSRTGVDHFRGRVRRGRGAAPQGCAAAGRHGLDRRARRAPAPPRPHAPVLWLINEDFRCDDSHTTWHGSGLAMLCLSTLG
jgi:hypothetical protein